jgi:HlyD family secretion protein
LRTVRPGHSNGVDTEILDGLRAGERVVVYPGDKVTDGTRIVPVTVN